ncbi:hypothetical protein U8P80_30690 (plasmid) [Rhizobium beringeri]|uniref:hypothetical protein n=1 Tax=Rhizobium leguminosarum TaxID=384 RepID=UPI00102F68C0|nr:hypothetical protein [Rhizobium leguminosarum]TAU35702.1 hypothetical protein ELI43_35905 [Rhizobium leguminosarum]TBC88515.1 hypothetical protein ELH26_30070 [Rhizobium leguminosarum]WSG77774.1 hypothetical protein U8P80_30690 [Rhizobium beringeri]WSH17969.1 hypothetical protein U8P74_30690 [Rhizobium beringeri]
MLSAPTLLGERRICSHSNVLKQPRFLRYQGNHLSCSHDKGGITDCGSFDVWRGLLGYDDRDREENRYHESASVIPCKTSQVDTSTYGAFRLAYFGRQPSRITGMAVTA